MERKFVPVRWTNVKLVISSIFRCSPSTLMKHEENGEVAGGLPILVIIESLVTDIAADHAQGLDTAGSFN